MDLHYVLFPSGYLTFYKCKKDAAGNGYLKA
jgi:hypothetical protein